MLRGHPEPHNGRDLWRATDFCAPEVLAGESAGMEPAAERTYRVFILCTGDSASSTAECALNR